MFRCIVFGFMVVMASSVQADSLRDRVEAYIGKSIHSDVRANVDAYLARPTAPVSYTNTVADDSHEDIYSYVGDTDNAVEEAAGEEIEEVCRSAGKWRDICKMMPVDRPWYNRRPNAYGVGEGIYRK